jgi:predicted dienelactone hydrolase
VNLPPRFWRGAAAGLAATAVGLSALAGSFLGTGLPPAVDVALAALAGGAAFFLGLLLLRGLASIGRRVPSRVLTFYGAAAVVLALLRLWFGLPSLLYYPSIAMLLLAQGALAGGLLSRRWSFVLAALALDALAIGFLASDGYDPYPVEEVEEQALPQALDLENPGEKGDYEVERFTYGSGTDQRREEFGKGADWTSQPVDATKLLRQWKGFGARAREWYWGFSLKEAPLNGRVWLPRGEGPFPLVLVVHGNHRMEEHSDPGYAYLGELLASRGFATVSVDENFVNGTWSGDFRGKEMPLRAWLLLEHLREWREWNETKGHRVEGKVDLGRVALAGHSRGGEAISIAAAFNQLSHFPDDTTVSFDYGFGIRSLVAIAQIDRRYSRRIQLEDVSFLALHGSYDGDEPSFHGLRQLRRIAFRDGEYRFKAGLYLHRANHGQFNTVWGRRDSGPPGAWLLNLAPLVEGEAQRQVARVAIAAFVEATLHDRREYAAFFRDPRVGREWLPDVPLVAQFTDSRSAPLATFEEDLDVLTATFPGARIETSGLTLWREEELSFRDDEKQGTSAAVLGWPETVREESAFYAIRFPPQGAAFGSASRLSFLLSGSVEDPAGEEGKTERPREVPSVEIEIEDLAGERSAIDLSELAPIAMPLEVRLLKLAWLDREAYGNSWEPILSSYQVAFEELQGRNPRVDLARVSAIRFRFRSEKGGVVILDDVGVFVDFSTIEERERDDDAKSREGERGNRPSQ